jgi:hypothetical protein
MNLMPDASPSKPRRKTLENPFIKAENTAWQITDPASLRRSISPPASKSRKNALNDEVKAALNDELPQTAAVEAGEATLIDQLPFWSTKLAEFSRSSAQSRLPSDQWQALYKDHACSFEGSHFVIHQHDHPVAGIHYDLRLQCNADSSISFAIMYGLPGDPNSRRLNRNATETRVHCFWNHLIETASLSTGSMLIWDTGHYEVLPYKEESADPQTDEESGDEYHEADEHPVSEQQKLRQAFSQRKIRLRLHGTHLPAGYTVSLRLTRENYRSEQPPPPSHKRKRKAPKGRRKLSREYTTSDSDSDAPSDLGPGGGGKMERNLSSLLRHETPPTTSGKTDGIVTQSTISEADPGGSDHENDDQETIRLNNAYPGATNDIGSIHQRKWYLSMDRRGSGFIPSKDKNRSTVWVRKKNEDGELQGFEPFHVLGRDVERSVVTGRLAKDILADEEVEGFVPRGKWRAVTE